jgi:glycosyltransferase involved in cell wall biosynthesis
LAGKLLTESNDLALTIVVPVHNMSGRLSHLSSWLDEAQELNAKVILVHDKSSDSTSVELEQLVQKKKCRNFSILNVEVKSPGLARNAGLVEVDTPWFSFADADDIVYVSALIRLLKETKYSGCELGLGAYSSIDLKTGNETIKIPPSNNQEALALHLAQTMGLWRFVFLSEQFKDIRFTNHRMGEDFVFANFVLNRPVRIRTSSEIVYRYFHGGESNLTSNKSIMNEMLGAIALIKKLDSTSGIGDMFSRFAAQKLSLSVLKNLAFKEALVKKFFLCIDLLSHPLQLKKLLFPAMSESVDRKRG